jgi:hypothetical protein
MADLSKFNSIDACEKGALMQVEDPTDGSPLFDEETKEPVTITFTGLDSKAFKKKQHELQNKRLKNLGRRGQTVVTAEALEADELELVVEAASSWSHIKDGEELDFNEANVRRVMRKYPWLLEQSSVFINSRSNFLGNS